MGIYSRAGEVLERNWHRLLKTIRLQLGRIRIYSIKLGSATRVTPLSLERSYPLSEPPLLGPVTIAEPRLTPIEIRDAFEGFDVDVEDLHETGEMSPEIHSQAIELADMELNSLATGLESRIAELQFSTAFDARVYDARVSLSDSRLGIYRVKAPGMAVRLESDLDQVLRVPLRRTAVPIKNLTTKQRIEYWNQVKESLDRPAANLKLIGIFRNVPKAGIKQAKVDPKNGLLRLWLAPGKRKDFRFGTLLIARDVKENKIFQIFARD